MRDTDIIYFADKKSGISTESADKVVLNFQKMRDEMQKEPQQKRPSAAAFNPILPKQAMPSVKPLRKQENPGTSSGTKFFNF
ncbi:MAG: hypothetical protein NTZ10_05700 [Candidatus Saganbacteria bacterium]|nr:hypothetical protein [Candidatus Saganbacteria bacterium]